MTVPPHELAIAIVPADIDDQGHVNNVVYVRWVQEVAIAHWTTYANAQDQAQVAWMVLRHEIDYKAPAKPGDSIVARTWVGAAERYKFERLTEILRAGDGKVLAKARTLWCPIARDSGRLIRLGDEIRGRFSTGPA